MLSAKSFVVVCLLLAISRIFFLVPFLFATFYFLALVFFFFSTSCRRFFLSFNLLFVFIVFFLSRPSFPTHCCTLFLYWNYGLLHDVATLLICFVFFRILIYSFIF